MKGRIMYSAWLVISRTSFIHWRSPKNSKMKLPIECKGLSTFFRGYLFSNGYIDYFMACWKRVYHLKGNGMSFRLHSFSSLDLNFAQRYSRLKTGSLFIDPPCRLFWFSSLIHYILSYWQYCTTCISFKSLEPKFCLRSNYLQHVIISKAKNRPLRIVFNKCV